MQNIADRQNVETLRHAADFETDRLTRDLFNDAAYNIQSAIDYSVGFPDIVTDTFRSILAMARHRLNIEGYAQQLRDEATK